jgi:WD40 repeat protein
VLDVDSDLHACSFSPDGNAALACQNGEVLIYDPVANRITRTLQAPGRAFGCAFSGDGRYLIAVGGHDLYYAGVKPYGEIALFEAPDWREVPRPEKKWPELATGCTFLLDCHRYAVAFQDGTIRILDALEAGLDVPVKAHRLPVRSLVAFKSSGREFLLTASADSEIKAWDIAQLTRDSQVARPDGRALFCAFSNETSQAWVWFAKVSGFYTDFSEAEYDFNTQAVSPPRVNHLPREYRGLTDFGIYSRDLAPDMPKVVASVSGWRKGSRSMHRSSPFADWGAYWIVAASARLLEHSFHLVPRLPSELYDWDNLTWARSVGGQMAILRRKQLLIVPPRGTNEISIPMQYTRLGHEEQPQCQYSRDGARIYAGYGNEVFAFEGNTGAPIASCTVMGEVACISESEEGDCLCIGCRTGHLIEWNMQTGRQTSYLAHPGGVTDCTYASGRHLLSIGDDGALLLWERGTPEPVAVFPTELSLSAFALSPVDNRIVAGGIHGDVHFLSLEGIAAKAPEKAVLPAAILPPAKDVLTELLQGNSASAWLAPELLNFRNGELVAYVDLMMAHLLEATDRIVAARLRAEAPAHPSIPDVLVAAAEVERKTFGPSEAIVQISQVIRGIARIVNATRASDFEYAIDVAKRFVWPRTRRLLLVATYGIAEAAGLRDTMKEILVLVSPQQL